MNFGFTEEQELLRAEVRKFLDQNCPLEEVRKIAATPEGDGEWGVAEPGCRNGLVFSRIAMTETPKTSICALVTLLPTKDRNCCAGFGERVVTARTDSSAKLRNRRRLL